MSPSKSWPHLEDVLAEWTEQYRGNVLLWKCVAEFIGTCILVTFGVGIVSNAVLTGVGISLFHGAFIWGMALTLGIYATASISSAHLNPAVSFAMAIMRSKEFSPLHFVCYVSSQLLGAFLAGLINFGVWNDWLIKYEAENNIIRGERSSIATSMIYGEFFPNPSVLPHTTNGWMPVHTWGSAFAVEAWGTGLFMFMILALTDKKQNTLRQKELVPLLIGISLFCVVSLVAPFTQACLNPARDLSLRIVAAMMGYGTMALPGPNGEMFVYILGPCFGALIGALVHDLAIAPGLRRNAKPYDIYQAAAHDLQRQGSLRVFETVGRRSSDEPLVEDTPKSRPEAMI